MKKIAQISCFFATLLSACSPHPGTEAGNEADASPVDTDNDGIPDTTDNCPTVRNPLQADFDHDGTGDVCDGCPADSLRVTPTELNPCAQLVQPTEPDAGHHCIGSEILSSRFAFLGGYTQQAPMLFSTTTNTGDVAYVEVQATACEGIRFTGLSFHQLGTLPPNSKTRYILLSLDGSVAIAFGTQTATGINFTFSNPMTVQANASAQFSVRVYFENETDAEQQAREGKTIALSLIPPEAVGIESGFAVSQILGMMNVQWIGFVSPRTPDAGGQTPDSGTQADAGQPDANITPDADAGTVNPDPNCIITVPGQILPAYIVLNDPLGYSYSDGRQSADVLGGILVPCEDMDVLNIQLYVNQILEQSQNPQSPDDATGNLLPDGTEAFNGFSLRFGIGNVPQNTPVTFAIDDGRLAMRFDLTVQPRITAGHGLPFTISMNITGNAWMANGTQQFMLEPGAGFKTDTGFCSGGCGTSVTWPFVNRPNHTLDVTYNHPQVVPDAGQPTHDAGNTAADGQLIISYTGNDGIINVNKVVHVGETNVPLMQFSMTETTGNQVNAYSLEATVVNASAFSSLSITNDGTILTGCDGNPVTATASDMTLVTGNVWRVNFRNFCAGLGGGTFTISGTPVGASQLNPTANIVFVTGLNAGYVVASSAQMTATASPFQSAPMTILEVEVTMEMLNVGYGSMASENELFTGTIACQGNRSCSVHVLRHEVSGAYDWNNGYGPSNFKLDRADPTSGMRIPNTLSNGSALGNPTLVTPTGATCGIGPGDVIPTNCILPSGSIIEFDLDAALVFEEIGGNSKKGYTVIADTVRIKNTSVYGTATSQVRMLGQKASLNMQDTDGLGWSFSRTFDGQSSGMMTISDSYIIAGKNLLY
jgi:hypothetical protein